MNRAGKEQPEMVLKQPYSYPLVPILPSCGRDIFVGEKRYGC